MVGLGADFIDREVEKKYECLKKIGRGLYGIVWQAVGREHVKSEPVAIKRIFNAFSNDVDAKRTYREVMYLSYFCDHPNIVKLHDVMGGDNDMDLYLVLELMDTDLASIIQTGLQPIHAQYITWQLLRALKYIHSVHVVHRDIKPQNIVLNSRCDVKLCDFGMARTTKVYDVDPFGPLPVEDKALKGKMTDFKVKQARSANGLNLTSYCSSRWYRSPEQLVNARNYSTGIDMWAAGCVIGEIIQRRPIFPGTCTLSQLSLIVHLTGRPPDSDLSSIESSYVIQLLEGIGKSKESEMSEILPAGSLEVQDLVRLLLQFNPDKRITATEALDHPYVGHFHHPDAEGTHAMSLAGGIALALSDDVQYHVSAYRDRIYADVLGIPASIQRVNQERRIKQELAGEKEFTAQQFSTAASSVHSGS